MAYGLNFKNPYFKKQIPFIEYPIAQGKCKFPDLVEVNNNYGLSYIVVDTPKTQYYPYTGLIQNTGSYDNFTLTIDNSGKFNDIVSGDPLSIATTETFPLYDGYLHTFPVEASANWQTVFTTPTEYDAGTYIIEASLIINSYNIDTNQQLPYIYYDTTTVEITNFPIVDHNPAQIVYVSTIPNSLISEVLPLAQQQQVILNKTIDIVASSNFVLNLYFNNNPQSVIKLDGTILSFSYFTVTKLA